MLEVKGSCLVLAMSEEQLKAAETEATTQVEEGVEEISEEDLGGGAGGCANNLKQIGMASDDGTGYTLNLG